MVVRREPCEICVKHGIRPCGYDDVIVEFENGTRERHYEPEVIAIVPDRSGGARSGTGLTARPADLIAPPREGRRTGRQNAPTPSRPPITAERADAIARAFHDTYERLAPEFGYRTRQASAVPWAEVPEDNKNLMRATVRELHDQGVLEPTDSTRVSVLSPEQQQQEERMQEEETTFGTVPAETPETLTGETESPAEPESPQEESAPESDAPAETAPEPEAEPESDDAPAEEEPEPEE